MFTTKLMPLMFKTDEADGTPTRVLPLSRNTLTSGDPAPAHTVAVIAHAETRSAAMPTMSQSKLNMYVRLI
jgi:hypothetical protein